MVSTSRILIFWIRVSYLHTQQQQRTHIHTYTQTRARAPLGALTIRHAEAVAPHVFADGRNDHTYCNQRDAFPWYYWPKRKHRVRLAVVDTATTTIAAIDTNHYTSTHFQPPTITVIAAASAGRRRVMPAHPTNISRGRQEIKRRMRKHVVGRGESRCSWRAGIAAKYDQGGGGGGGLLFAWKRNGNARCNDCRSDAYSNCTHLLSRGRFDSRK